VIVTFNAALSRCVRACQGRLDVGMITDDDDVRFIVIRGGPRILEWVGAVRGTVSERDHIHYAVHVRRPFSTKSFFKF